MTETERAVQLANAVLEDSSRDPDDELAMMSRQFLRAREDRIAKLDAVLEKLDSMAPPANVKPYKSRRKVPTYIARDGEGDRDYCAYVFRGPQYMEGGTLEEAKAFIREHGETDSVAVGLFDRNTQEWIIVEL